MAESDRWPPAIVVVGEARADAEIGTELADRVFIEQRDYLDGILDSVRQWRGVSDDVAYLTWADAKRLATAGRLRAHGHFAGEPGAKDAIAARRTLLLLRALIDDAFDAVVFVRDADDAPDDTRRGLEQSREEWSRADDRPIVIAVANPMREAWVLAGFEPANDDEQAHLDALRTGDDALGFDPCACSHRLTASDEQAKRSAKRVMDHLVRDDYERQRACWRDTPLDTLRERGQDNGLTAYLDEVAEHLVPVIDRDPRDVG